MNDCGSLELAAARLGARWGRRADAAAWRRVESSRSLAAALEAAQACGLAPWVEGITATTPVHALEQALRRRFAGLVDELAGWTPAPWQAAVRWCAVLPELPLVRHLAAGKTPPAWLDADAEARERWLAAPPSSRAGAATRPLRPACAELLERARRDPNAVLPAWQAQWHRFAPPGAAREAVESLFAELWPAHRESLRQRHADTASLYRALEARLVAQWRRAPLEPLAVFVHVALLALVLERVRGELVVRAAFPGFPVTTTQRPAGRGEAAADRSLVRAHADEAEAA